MTDAVIRDHIEDFFMQKIHNSYFLFLFRMNFDFQFVDFKKNWWERGGGGYYQIIFKDSRIYFILLNTKYKNMMIFLWWEMFAVERWPLSLKGLRTTDFEYSTGM